MVSWFPSTIEAWLPVMLSWLGGLVTYARNCSHSLLFAACLWAAFHHAWIDRQELVYETALNAGTFSLVLIAWHVSSNIAVVAFLAIVAITPFLRPKRRKLRSTLTQAPASMWLGPMILRYVGLLLGVFSRHWPDRSLFSGIHIRK